MWSQVLTPDEAKVWSSCALRDISHDITLKSGIRTPKTIVDEAIKKYKVKSDQEKYDSLTSPLSQPFESTDLPSESIPPANRDLTDPHVILPQELVISENMVADFSAPDSPHSGELSLPDPANVTPPVQMSEPRILQSGQAGYSEHLLQISQNKVREIRKLKQQHGK